MAVHRPVFSAMGVRVFAVALMSATRVAAIGRFVLLVGMAHP
jgi:hypothetical protein